MSPSKEDTAATTTAKVSPTLAPGRPSLTLPVMLGAGGAAIALLLASTRFPIWRAHFSAPQYPKGLDISAYGDRVTGDLGEIHEISHYIGMPPFNFVGMPEMKLWLPVILVAVAMAMVAVVTGRRWLRRLACGALWLIPVGALADVQFRLWQTGHALDPTSPLRVPPFTPKVVGPTSLMNFTMWGLPGLALLLVAAAAATVTFAPMVARRRTR